MYKKTLMQMIRYGFIATFGLGIDFGTLIFFTEVLQFYYLVGVCAGFIAGLIVTYVLSNRYVFGAPKGNNKKIFILFGIIGLVGLGILNLFVWILTSGIGINYLISKSLATIVVFLWNFFARKTLYDPQEIEMPYEL